LDVARAVGGAAALAEWRGEEVLPGPGITGTAAKRDFLEKAAFTHHHPVGTCRMGQGKEAVVDSKMRVQGIGGLFVCDASVIPSITTGPVNAAIVAMAERTSDLLRGKRPLARFDPRQGRS
jgi:choline dehydrogenase-like flavoprotein